MQLSECMSATEGKSIHLISLCLASCGTMPHYFHVLFTSNVQNILNVRKVIEVNFHQGLLLYTDIDQTLVNSLHGLLLYINIDQTLVNSLHGLLLYTNIDQTLVNSLNGLLNCGIGGIEIHVITTEYRTRVNCIHM